MTRAAPTVVWFRRDLRLHDHPALTDALRDGGPVAPLFVLDPALLHGRFASPNRTWYLLEAIRGLGEALEARGNGLAVRVGRPVEVVPAFAREVGAAAVVVSRDYAPYGRQRDREVADALGRDGIAFRAKRGLLVHEPEDLPGTDGGSPRLFSPFLRRWERLPIRALLPAPDEIPAVAASLRAPTGLTDLALDLPGPTADPALLPEPGEAAARARLDAWLGAGPEHGPAAYHRTRDRLDDNAATSRLSPDLRLGLLSPVEVVTRALAVDGGAEGSRRFTSELAWRDFYAHVLWHEPRVAREPFVERFAGVVPPGSGEASIEAWRTGRTGYPIVDAPMRQLAASGFLPNRARMIVASFLTKDLLADWRVGEAHFMRHLLDGDPASNLGGWQWAASVGTDAQPYIRVFNPVTQGERFDPEGAYVRRWLPELARVPTPLVHAPWRMTSEEQARARCRIGLEYPAPIVDHAEARRRAIEWFASVTRPG
jgi:deoxyribodipyrimidine photo-lyase